MPDHPDADRPGDEPGAAAPAPPAQPERRPAEARNVLLPVFGILAVVLLAFAVFSGSDDPEAADSEDATDPLEEPELAEPEATDADPDDAAGDSGAAAEDATDGLGDDAAAPGEASPEEIEEMQQALRELERREDGDPFALGAVDAPVVMILWSDFQCPFCATFGRDTKPALVERFVDDGTLRIEWRDYPLLGDSSVTAAMAGRAAAEQGAFWELHDEIFAEDRPRDSLDEQTLTAMAGDLGLDTERFAADLDDEDLWSAVASDQALASQLGITGTPAFLVGGTPVLGAQSEDFFAELIDELVAQG